MQLAPSPHRALFSRAAPIRSCKPCRLTAPPGTISPGMAKTGVADYGRQKRRVRKNARGPPIWNRKSHSGANAEWLRRCRSSIGEPTIGFRRNQTFVTPKGTMGQIDPTKQLKRLIANAQFRGDSSRSRDFGQTPFRPSTHNRLPGCSRLVEGLRSGRSDGTVGAGNSTRNPIDERCATRFRSASTLVRLTPS
jgi:hypothetical protein